MTTQSIRIGNNQLVLSLAVLLALLPVGRSLGAVITTASSTAPTTDIAISNTPTPEGNFSWKMYPAHWTEPRRDVGQTFTVATAFTLDAITLQIASFGSGAPGAEFNLSLHTYASNSSTTPQTTLWTDSGTLPATLNANDYLSFDVTDTSLNADTVYGFTLQFASSASNRAVNFLLDFGNTYSSGVLPYSTDGSTWSAAPNDYNFYIQSIVPEPSVGVLLLSGAGLLLACPRRRKSDSGRGDKQV